MQKNNFLKKRKNAIIQCQLCSHFCTLSDANIKDSCSALPHTGKCRVRKNVNGNLESFITNKISSYNIDPVEKKPLYHFLPNTQTFSLGTMGCNFDCAWCQNSSIAHPLSEKSARHGTLIDTQNLMETCKKYHCPSVSFTYNEPTIFFELMYDCAKKAQEMDIKTIMVSNGYQSPQLLQTLLPLINAANIDLKSYRDISYQKFCNARLKPVLNTLKSIAKSNTWLEVTTLLIPKINDTQEELKDIASFIYNELGEYVPWHISAFSPQRKMRSTPRTSKESLINAYEIGKKQGLKHVYIGNASFTNKTICTNCNETLIIRDTYSTNFPHLTFDKNNTIQNSQKHSIQIKQKTENPSIFNGFCQKCHTKLAGIW